VRDGCFLLDLVFVETLSAFWVSENFFMVRGFWEAVRDSSSKDLSSCYGNGRIGENISLTMHYYSRKMVRVGHLVGDTLRWQLFSGTFWHFESNKFGGNGTGSIKCDVLYNS
jgi:hypothetical protein